jgi:uncharacterized membrane protein YfcA
LSLQNIDYAALIFPTLIFIIGGFVKGVIGLGLPAISMGLLGLLMVPGQAATLLVVPSTVTNVWQLVAGPSIRALVKRLWSMQVGICAGVWLGSGALVGAGAGNARLWLGAMLGLYGLYGLFAPQPRVPRRWEVWLSPIVGVMTGIATASTGVFTLPMVPYINGLGLDRENLVQALGLSFTVCTLALAVDLTGAGALDRSMLVSSIVAVVPSLLGMFIGTYVRGRISPVLFRRCFFAGMLVLGLELVRH